MMNLGIESETLEFKKSTSEVGKAMDNIASMLNKHGHGTVFFGVSPKGDVVGQSVSASSLDEIARKVKEAIKPMIYPEIRVESFSGKDVIRVDFSGTERPYSSFGRYYKRVFDRTEEMTPGELRAMLASTDYSSSWENNLTEYGLEAVDTVALETFYSKAVSCGRLESMAQFDCGALLSGLGLYEKGKLTNAGYYLFSNRRPVVLKMAVFLTDERIGFSDICRLEDNIFNLIGKGFSYIKEHINWRVESGSGTSRIEVPEIPVEAIREIVVNSFAHADYRGISENEIDITPTMVEIYNPGEFPAGLSPQMFALQRIKSMPRNRVILNTLYKSKDVELFGSGFRKVFACCEKYDVKVSSTSMHGGFSFIFHRAGHSRHEYKPGLYSDGMIISERYSEYNLPTDEKVLALLKENPCQTRSDLAERTGKTVRTIQRALDRLADSGRIRRTGSNRKGSWEVQE